MSRREGREAIFKTLFEIDLNPNLDLMTALQTAKDEYANFTDNDSEYALSTLKGVNENLNAIDSLISSSSPDWKIERMAAVDRAILRLATFEMKFAEEKLKPNIAINEAVELAKKFGADDSSRFINGVLSGILKK